MNKKLAGFIFLGMALMDVVILLMYRLIPGFSVSLPGRLFLSEAIMIVPCFTGWAFSRERFSESYGIKKIRFSLIPACVLLTILLTPLTALVNLSTLVFTENEAGAIFQSLSGLPFPLVALFVAVIGPLVEEFTFRGILYTGIRKNGSALQAVFFTALAFGLFHMNLNQAAYAFLLGLFFATLREISGSVWPSSVCHICINGSSTLMLWLAGDDAVTEAGEVMSKDTMLIAAGGLMLVALVATTLALALLMWVSEVCGKDNGFTGIFSEHKKEKSRVLSLPLLIGYVICIVNIIRDLAG